MPPPRGTLEMQGPPKLAVGLNCLERMPRMTALLSLEPRVAGTEIVEPDADFGAAKWVDLHDRARCLISLKKRTRVCAD
jgi:hypothetical protein